MMNGIVQQVPYFFYLLGHFTQVFMRFENVKMAPLTLINILNFESGYIPSSYNMEYTC